MKREDTRRARLIRFLTCRTVRASGCPFELLFLCAVAAAASLLHGVVCLVLARKGLDGFTVWYGMEWALWIVWAVWMGMHGLGQDARMRVRLDWPENQSLILIQGYLGTIRAVPCPLSAV